MTQKEANRIAAAEQAAQAYANTLPPETVKALGLASIISDLTREFLMNGIPSGETLTTLGFLH